MWGVELGYGKSVGQIGSLDKTRRTQRFEGAILGHRLQRASRHLDGDKLLEFGNPDALGFEVGFMPAGHDLRHVHADSAFFLGETAAMDFAPALRFRTCNVTLTSHKFDKRGESPGNRPVRQARFCSLFCFSCCIQQSKRIQPPITAIFTDQ